MKQINRADLDSFKVTMVMGNFKQPFKHFTSNTITKSNDLIRHLLSIIDSLLVENTVLPNQTIL